MGSRVEKITRKTFKIRESGRSSDYIAPSFGYGCLLNCTYCYMKRHKAEGLDVATNIETILTEIRIFKINLSIHIPYLICIIKKKTFQIN